MEPIENIGRASSRLRTLDDQARVLDHRGLRKAQLSLSSNNVLLFIWLAYAIVMALFLTEDMRNYLVLFAACVGVVALFAFRLEVASDLLVASVLFAYMAVVAEVLGTTRDLGSVALTTLYAMGYFAIVGLIKKPSFDRLFAQRVFAGIICACAAVSVVQMVTSLAGLPIPNLIASKGLWSYNSLATEPSQLARTVGISMLAYLIVARPTRRPESLLAIAMGHKEVMLAFMITMLLSGSAMAALAIPLVLLFALSIRWVVLASAALIVIWPLALLVDFEPLQRALKLLSSRDSLDVSSIAQADGSGSLRVIPAVIYLQESIPEDLAFWFGYGRDGLFQFFQGRLPGMGEKVGSGFLPGFLVTYGVIGTALFLGVFSLRFINRSTTPIFAFFIIFMSSSAWNTQVFWYALIVLRIVYQVEIMRAARRGSAPS